MGPWRSPDFVSGSAGWQIDADGSAEFNNVVVRGTIYAEAGEIAGWTLAAGHLYAGTGGAARVGLKPGTYPFYAGAEAEASAPFRVNTGGEMWATNAHISGEITATTGTIGGWTISATEIKSGTNIVLDSSVPSIVIGASGYIQSSNYVSGFDGFYIDNGFAEFGNVNVRGSLHCAVFVKDLISAHAGTLLVTKSAGKLDADFTVAPAAQMVVEPPPGGGWLFDGGDIVRLKETYASGVHETWIEVAQSGVENTYNITYKSGDNTVTYHRGTTAVDYGASGDGGILQTADMANAPWLSVFTHAGAPWTTLTHHLRLGNLNGMGGYSSDKYGIFIGDYAGDKWMSYDPTKSLRIRGDALIEGTVTAEKLYMGIGDSIFDADDGLLLLGPSCEINATEWWSLRKQKATISGAFHQEGGRWLNTRALMVESAATNLLADPVCGYDANLTLWTDWSPGATFASTRSQAYSALYSDYIGKLDNSGEAGSAVFYQTLTVTATSYTLTARVRKADRSAVTSSDLGVQFNSGTVTPSFTWLGGGWYLLEHTGTPTAGNRSFGLVIVAGKTLYTDGLQLENSAYATSFAWWGAGPGYTGSVTTTSVRATTEINLDAHVGLVSNNATVSYRVLVQSRYASTDTFPCSYPRIWEALYDTSNYVSVVFDTANEKIYAEVKQGGTLISLIPSSTTPFATGDQLDIVLTIDFTNDAYNLYLDGELAASSTTGINTFSLSNWNLGTDYTGAANYGGWAFSEYAALDKILSAAEVAAIHALQRPLVDIGSMDSPGIYILDGRFKIASSLTGNRIEIDADEIAGYNSAGTRQFYLQASDGAAYAGGGAVRLNKDGLQIVADSAAGTPEKFRMLYDDSGTLRLMGNVYADWGGGGSDPNITWVTSWRQSGDPWPADNQVILLAYDTVAGTDVRIEVHSNKHVEVWGEEIFYVSKLLRPGTGTADPTAQLEDGCLFYRTDTDKLRLRANGAWVNLN
jgi:hypothetical protein